MDEWVTGLAEHEAKRLVSGMRHSQVRVSLVTCIHACTHSFIKIWLHSHYVPTTLLDDGTGATRRDKVPVLTELMSE
jgi:hypothetical protein